MSPRTRPSWTRPWPSERNSETIQGGSNPPFTIQTYFSQLSILLAMYISDWEYVKGQAVRLPYGDHVADYNVIVIAITCALVAALVCIMVHIWRLTKCNRTRTLFIFSRGMKLAVIMSLVVSVSVCSTLSYYFTVYLRVGNWVLCDTGDGCILGSLVSLVFGILFSCFFFSTLTSIAKLPHLMKADVKKIRAAQHRIDTKQTNNDNTEECEA